MRINRSVQAVTVLTTLATLAACSSGRGGMREQPDANHASVSVQWDSGPLDQAYHHERSDMDARHSQEIASPRADESSDQRVQRQAAEDQDLEHRYAQGKASHSQTLPPSDRQGHDDKPGDKSHE